MHPVVLGAENDPYRVNLFYGVEPSSTKFCLLLVLDHASLQNLLFWR